jgi:SpoVK/Ycf46/Vps4 family AAA+-type ATPase
LSGADIKSIVCDSFLKAFHRLHSTSTTHDLQEETILRSSIRINQSDFISSIEAIQQTINKNERIKLKKM